MTRLSVTTCEMEVGNQSDQAFGTSFVPLGGRLPSNSQKIKCAAADASLFDFPTIRPPMSCLSASQRQYTSMGLETSFPAAYVAFVFP